ncbi:MAG: hypothetical protein PHW69_07410, partial [Elusimicrobiaceae bacterium]|nr:hypothetical protein [Elusimicrobiaceae bacterium]
KGGDDEKTAAQAEKERKAMTSAFEKIVAGKTADGGAELKKFLSDYPASPYADTAKQALEKLQSPVPEKAAPDTDAGKAGLQPDGK